MTTGDKTGGGGYILKSQKAILFTSVGPYNLVSGGSLNPNNMMSDYK